MRSSLARRPAQPDQRQHGGLLLCDQALPGDLLNQISDSMGGSSYAIKPYQETCSTGLATARGVTVNQVAFLGYIIIILGDGKDLLRISDRRPDPES